MVSPSSFSEATAMPKRSHTSSIPGHRLVTGVLAWWAIQQEVIQVVKQLGSTVVGHDPVEYLSIVVDEGRG